MVRTLIVDGYNTIHAWPALRSALHANGLEDARRRLIAALAGYSATEQVRVTVVFDAPRGAARTQAGEMVDGVEVRFSGGHESADHLIERLAYLATRGGPAEDVVVATSDRLQRDMVRAMGVTTMDARTLEAEVAAAATGTAERADRLRDQAGNARRVEHHLTADVRARLERLRRGEPTTPPPSDDPTP